MIRKFLSVLGIAVSLATLSVTASAAYTSFTVFGDSLSDDGNVYIITGGAAPLSPPYAQRFSNGPVAAERLGNRLGLPLGPSLLGGNDFAFGGAQTGTGNINAALNGTGVLGQIGMFAGGGGSFNNSSLVMLWAGPNDFFAAPVPATIGTAISNLSLSIQQLYGLGARHILMPNMPNLGITPDGIASGNPGGLTLLTSLFNAALDSMIGTMEGLLGGLDIIEFDAFSFVNDVVANPGAYGFSNVSQRCLVGLVACANPDEYLFWDGVHPTAAAHRMLGDALMAAVPEPGSIALLLAALLVMATTMRRARIR